MAPGGFLFIDFLYHPGLLMMVPGRPFTASLLAVENDGARMEQDLVKPGESQFDNALLDSAPVLHPQPRLCSRFKC
jgi:hypothetical protein